MYFPAEGSSERLGSLVSVADNEAEERWANLDVELKEPLGVDQVTIDQLWTDVLRPCASSLVGCSPPTLLDSVIRLESIGADDCYACKFLVVVEPSPPASVEPWCLSVRIQKRFFE